MAVALVTTHRNLSRRKKTLTIQATTSSTYATGGQVIDLTKVTNPKLISGGLPSAIPTSAEVVGGGAGYVAEFIIGTTIANSKLKVFASPGTELPAGNFPAAINADPFIIEVTGPLGNF